MPSWSIRGEGAWRPSIESEGGRDGGRERARPEAFLFPPRPPPLRERGGCGGPAGAREAEGDSHAPTRHPGTPAIECGQGGGGFFLPRIAREAEGDSQFIAKRRATVSLPRSGGRQSVYREAEGDSQFTAKRRATVSAHEPGGQGGAETENCAGGEGRTGSLRAHGTLRGTRACGARR